MLRGINPMAAVIGGHHTNHIRAMTQTDFAAGILAAQASAKTGYAPVSATSEDAARMSAVSAGKVAALSRSVGARTHGHLNPYNQIYKNVPKGAAVAPYVHAVTE